MRRCSLFVVVAVVAAALGLPQSGHGTTSPRSDVTAEYPYLVGLTTGGKDDETNRHTVVCTGTLVTPVVVLSSAYCTSSLTTAINESSKDIALFAYWKTPSNSVKYHRAIGVFTHPSYDKAMRTFDLALIKLKKPFKQVERFVALSSKTFERNVELSCVVIGIGAPGERSYKVPVRVKYGRTACRIPNSGLKFLIGFTWKDFLCADTVGLADTQLPCNRADPLLCSDGRYQYGISSLSYDGTGASPVTECGDPAIQVRHFFVNRNTDWIAETVAKLNADEGSGSRQLDKNKKTTVRLRRPTSPRPTASSTRVEVPEASFTDHPEVSYPYLVYLEGLPDEPVCGGTLISPWHVLTTAYCTTRMTEIMVTVTTYRRRSSTASLVYVHPDFNSYTLTADISIVILREPLNVVRYAQLPDMMVSGGGVYNDGTTKSCVVVGSRRLTPYHYVPVDVEYGPGACRPSFDSEIQTTVNETWREFICGMLSRRLGNDTGDPLICDGLQYGIISHAYRTKEQASKTGSADQMRFLVVDNHIGWIDNVMASDYRIGGNSGDGGGPNPCTGLAVIMVLQLVLAGVCSNSWLSQFSYLPSVFVRR